MNALFNPGRLIGVLIGLMICPAASLAQTDSRRLAEMNLQELMNESVTSVSKKETLLHQAPAAVTVITQDDIRRSGHTSIPELLRLVPGLNVARVDANQWAITARGFNDQFANKLLVLIDGRSIYAPTFAGVYWNDQDLLLEDLDRIEVIRGPGATLWGANAVNGVINIITKSASQTQGALITTTYGTEDQPAAGIRYGGQLATNWYYRVYAKYFNRNGFVDASGKEAPDGWDMTRGGVRLDGEPSDRNAFTLQGEYYNGRAGERVSQASLTPPFSRTSDKEQHNYGGYVLGRWQHQFSDSSELTVQGYYDYYKHSSGTSFGTQDTYDLELQHRFPLGSRQDIVWGVGYRHTASRLPSTFGLTWNPERDNENIYNAFLQNEITLVPGRLKLTLGSKFEHNSYTGFEIQPSARLLWMPSDRQSLWAAVSRAVRTPSRFDLHSRLNVAAFQPPNSPPMLVSLFGNPDLTSENLIAYELGYRVEPHQRLALDLTAFYNIYDDLIHFERGAGGFEATPAPPHVLVNPRFAGNSLSGETYGAELSARWQATDSWRLTAGYTWLQMRLRPDPAAELASPRHQFHLRSYVDLRHNLELNGAVYFVDQITPLRDRGRIPSYFRLDVGLSWRPAKSLEIGIWGQNLLDNQHREFPNRKTTLQVEVPRTVYGKITWKF